jgi:hypothetical protein
MQNCTSAKCTFNWITRVSGHKHLYLVQRSVETIYYTVGSHCTCRAVNMSVPEMWDYQSDADVHFSLLECGGTGM